MFIGLFNMNTNEKSYEEIWNEIYELIPKDHISFLKEMEDIKEFFRFFNDDKIIDSFNFNFLKFFLLEDTIINHLPTTEVFESPYDQIYEIYSKNFHSDVVELKDGECLY